MPRYGRRSRDVRTGDDEPGANVSANIDEVAVDGVKTANKKLHERLSSPCLKMSGEQVDVRTTH
jgi:hypothetical protein